MLGSSVTNLIAGAIDELFPRQDASWFEAVDNGWRCDDGGGYCRRCGASAGAGSSTDRGCAFCVESLIAWDRLTRLGLYQPPLDDWLRAMKFEQRWAWGRRLGRLLAESIERDGASKPTDSADPRDPETPPAPPERVVVCAVPMYFVRRWRRGYNQAELLARAMADARGWPYAGLLRRVRYTLPQTDVPVSKRSANISESFATRAIDLSGWHVWLVDDIKTTGATLNACARLLRKMGAERISVAVAAVADPKHAAFQVK